MKQIKAFAILFALLPLAALAQEVRIDTVIPKFLSNGYFFREMPQLPDGEKTMSRLKDKDGNSVTVINVNTTLPKSVIRKAIPREQVHNADQFLSGLNMMATMTSLTQAGIKDDVLRIRNGSFYSGPGDYTLFVLDGNMLHPRQVRLGECNYDYIEVISGLESGEQVIVSDMTKYKGKEKLKVE